MLVPDQIVSSASSIARVDPAVEDLGHRDHPHAELACALHERWRIAKAAGAEDDYVLGPDTRDLDDARDGRRHGSGESGEGLGRVEEVDVQVPDPPRSPLQRARTPGIGIE